MGSARAVAAGCDVGSGSRSGIGRTGVVVGDGRVRFASVVFLVGIGG